MAAKKIQNKLKFFSRLNLKYLGVLVVVGGLIFLFAKWGIVAWVDSTPITRVQLYKQLEARFGDDLKQQLIVEALINSEALKRKIVVNSDDINAEYKKTQSQVGGAESLQSLLSQQKITEGDFKKQLKLQLLVRKMFEAGVSVSDEEVNKYIEENKQSLTANSSNQSPVVDEKMKAEITEQLKQQKISQNFRSWMEDQLKSARVKRI